VLKRAVAQLFEYAERRKTLLDQFAGALRDESLNHRQTFLLNDAARGRVRQITIAEHQRQHGVSYLTARADLEDLVERRLFRKKKQGRTSLYISASDLVRRLGGEEAPQQS
jgi:Fic family protein